MSDLDRTLQVEIRRLTHLVAALGTDGKPQREQIRLLASAGFPPKDIANLAETIKWVDAIVSHGLSPFTRNFYFGFRSQKELTI